MDENNFEETFLKDGFAVVKNCIDKNILDEAKQIMSEALSRKLGKKVNYNEGFLEAIKNERQFEVQEYLYRDLAYQNLAQKVLNSKEVLNKFITLLGPDLCYTEYPGFPVNVPEVKDDYLVKKWHQEYWSGCGVHTVNFWFPVSIEEGMGGLELIPGSHEWGHIPHRNREPIEIPDCAQYIIPKVMEGDAVFMHTFTLHRTVVNKHKYPRFAISIFVKNFYHTDTGVPEFQIWFPFHFSALAKIHKKLGNPEFSPFRTLNSARKENLMHSYLLAANKKE